MTNRAVRLPRSPFAPFTRHLPLLAIGAALLACSSGSSGDATAAAETVGKAASPIIAGTSSDSSQDAVVLLVHYDPTSQLVGACSGTLLSDRLVLTARHCVADTDESAECDINGAPIAGGVVRGDHAANTLYVFVGPNRPDFSGGSAVMPDATGAQVIDDGSTTLCDHDVALVVLDRAIPNAKIMPIRLDGDVTKGDTITSIGWGVTSTSSEPATRQQRSGVVIEAVGPVQTSDSIVSPSEFQVGESICSGDSGGPAVASTGATIGVVSRGGNGVQPTQTDPSVACVGGTTENFYSKTSPFKDLVMQGFAAVGATPWLEGGPDPRLGTPGTACTDGSTCGYGLCLRDPVALNTLTCAQDCSVTACPDGQTCTAQDGNMVCRDPAAVAAASNAAQTTTTTHGCATSPASRSASGSGALCLLGLALVVARRRRS